MTWWVRLIRILIVRYNKQGWRMAGFDPMDDIVDSDSQQHDSIAYEVIEPIRPFVDKWLLDFYDGRDRVIRLTRNNTGSS